MKECETSSRVSLFDGRNIHARIDNIAKRVSALGFLFVISEEALKSSKSFAPCKQFFN